MFDFLAVREFVMRKIGQRRDQKNASDDLTGTDLVRSATYRQRGWSVISVMPTASWAISSASARPSRSAAVTQAGLPQKRRSLRGQHQRPKAQQDLLELDDGGERPDAVG